MLTKQPNETLGRLEELEGVDASVGDRHISERLESSDDGEYKTKAAK
jgi:hypothetical protein